MHAAVSEATRQIVEFEELVSRLDRINNSGSEPDLGPPQIESRTEPSSITSSYSRRHRPDYASSLNNVRRPSRSENFLSLSTDHQHQHQQEPVRVHIGIDEDLRMILEMDPSIVDRVPAPPVAPPHSTTTTTTFARAPRATRPQGWYWTARD